MELSELRPFTCTIEARIDGLEISHERLTALLNPVGAVEEIHSNYGHKSLAGPIEPKKPRRGRRRRCYETAIPNRKQRQPEGDGSCFNSAVEAVIRLTPGAPKIYKLKYFPTGGTTQIPGVIEPDLSDGRRVVEIWVEFLNRALAGVAQVRLHQFKTNMINYMFRVQLDNPEKDMIDLERVAQAVRDTPGATSPFPVIDTLLPAERNKLTVQFQAPDKRSAIRVHFFPFGKINELGVNTRENGTAIYEYLCRVFAIRGRELVYVPPEPDDPQALELAQAEGEILERFRRGRATPSRPKPADEPTGAASSQEIEKMTAEILERWNHHT